MHAVPMLDHKSEKISPLLVKAQHDADVPSQKRSRRKWIVGAFVLAGLVGALVVTFAVVKAAKDRHTHTSVNSNATAASKSITPSSVTVSATLTSTSLVTARPTLTGNWPQGWTEAMVFPTGYAGTGKNGLQGSQKASSATSGGKYSQLVALGSSYSDNVRMRWLRKAEPPKLNVVCRRAKGALAMRSTRQVYLRLAISRVDGGAL